MDDGYGYSNVDIHDNYPTKPFINNNNTSNWSNGGNDTLYHGQFGPAYSQFGWPHVTPFHQGTVNAPWGEQVYTHPENYWRGYDDHDFYFGRQGRRNTAASFHQPSSYRGLPSTGGAQYSDPTLMPRRTSSLDDLSNRNFDSNSNEVLISHRYGENVRMNHPNIPTGATVREVIETDTGMRGANLKRGYFAKRHMKFYEVELARAQEHLHRAAQAAKVGDWRAHDALVETAILRQKRADMHWAKAHSA